MRGFIRLAAILILVAAGVPVAWWGIEGVSDGDLLNFWYYWPRPCCSTFLVVVGVGLWAVNKALSKLLIPLPGPQECPKCGFLLRGLTVPRCPECGTDLPAELISHQPPIQPPPVMHQAREGPPPTPPPPDERQSTQRS